jgi:5'-nucleotidase
MVRWVFFDVGNVLLDEDPLTYCNFRRHVEAIRRVRPDRSFSELLAERESRAESGSRWPLYEVAASYLDEAACADAWESSSREVRARYADLSPPIPGAVALLDHLAPHVRLGLIANQGAECRARLEALGWLGRFEVVALAEERGVAKPDPALFRLALTEAGADPRDCLMVGDRLDNDIAPAASLGMPTAWVRWPCRRAKGWPADDDPEALAYLASLERTAARDEARIGVISTIAVDTIAGLDAVLSTIRPPGWLHPGADGQ